MVDGVVTAGMVDTAVDMAVDGMVAAIAVIAVIANQSLSVPWECPAGGAERAAPFLKFLHTSDFC